MRFRWTRFFGYTCFVGVPSIGGYAFTLLAGFGLSAQNAAMLFFGIALANTVRFSLSPQTTHWLPKRMAVMTAPQAAAGLKAVVFFELAVAVVVYAVFVAVIFAFSQFTDNYSFSDLLPFGVFVFSTLVPLFSTLQRQWASIRLPAVFIVFYWLVRVALLAIFVVFDIPESGFIVALACFEAVAYIISLALIFRLFRILNKAPYEGPGQKVLDFPTIKNMIARSTLRGSLREADILCAGLIGSPNVLVEYRIVRSLALAVIRGLGPVVDLAFVSLAKRGQENADRIWERQKQVAAWAGGIFIFALVPMGLFAGAYIKELIGEHLRLDEPGLPEAFLLLTLAGLAQVALIALYPLAMQYERHTLVFRSSLGGAIVFVPLLFLSVQMQMISFLAASYLAYICTILAINFVGVMKHAR